MRPRIVGLAILIALGIGSTGCKPKIEATLKGFKEGSTDIAIVHVKASGNAEIKCTDAGQRCTSTYTPNTGEMDLDVWISDTSKPKKVFIEVTRKGKKAEAVVDLGTLPATLSVVRGYGTISCVSKDCAGTLTVAPSPKISLTAPAGTVVEIGSDKLTVPATGSIVDAPVNLGFALDKQPIDKVCIGLVGGSTPDAVLGSTTLALTFPDKTKLQTKVDINSVLAQRNLAAVLKKVTSGPVVFPWEKPGAVAKGKRAAIYVENDQCYDAGQPGATIADLDVIALSEDQTRVGECTYQLSEEKSGKGAGSASGKITMYDSHASAYDRITGKKLGTKLFLAPKECTSEIKLGYKGSTIQEQTSYANEDQIAAWAVTLAK